MRKSGILLAAAVGALLLPCPTLLRADDSHSMDTAPAPPVPSKTGKERLSDKASDEQRVDNCKVPPERQGTAARPDACTPPVRTSPTN